MKIYREHEKRGRKKAKRISGRKKMIRENKLR